MEVYTEIKQVNATLGYKPTQSKKTIDSLNKLTDQKIEYLQLTSRTQVINIAKRMMLKKTLCRVMQNSTDVLDDDIKYFKTMLNGVTELVLHLVWGEN